MDVEGKVADLQSHMIAREKELSSCKAKLSELTKQVKALETENADYQHEKAALKKELIATKELCDKLDNEKEKLNAEVNEYSAIRRDVCLF